MGTELLLQLVPAPTPARSPLSPPLGSLMPKPRQGAQVGGLAEARSTFLPQPPPSLSLSSLPPKPRSDQSYWNNKTRKLNTTGAAPTGA